jgi:hypothetical protein
MFVDNFRVAISDGLSQVVTRWNVPMGGSATPPVVRPGALPGVILVAWSTNFTWILGLGLLLLILYGAGVCQQR